MWNINRLSGGRLHYLDALRGFSMILVVVGHVLPSMGIGSDSSVLGSIILTFRMPLFFFVSGFFAYRATEKWTSDIVIDILKRKIQAQIVCPILFFALTAYIGGGNYLGWIRWGFGGYWFTIVLFQIYIVYLVITLISKAIKVDRLVDIAMIAISILLVGILVLFRGDSQLWNVLCVENTTKYFQFFTFGILSRKYFKQFSNIISKDNVKAAIVGSYIVMLLFYFSDAFRACSPLLYQANHDIFVRYTGLLVVYLLFFINKEYFSLDSEISNILRFIGQRTLDIYMIHYLLIPNLSFMQDYLTTGNMIIFQLVVSMVISILIISICLLISQILRSSKLLSYFLFGVKYKIHI